MSLQGTRRTQEEQKVGKKFKRKGHEKTEETGIFLAIDWHGKETVSEGEEDN
jgi:hypothetical protein